MAVSPCRAGLGVAAFPDNGLPPLSDHTHAEMHRWTWDSEGKRCGLRYFGWAKAGNQNLRNEAHQFTLVTGRLIVLQTPAPKLDQDGNGVTALRRKDTERLQQPLFLSTSSTGTGASSRARLLQYARRIRMVCCARRTLHPTALACVCVVFWIGGGGGWEIRIYKFCRDKTCAIS